ncbi:thiamine pyrophosphate-dependent dehydrogenase E1 component subunit alpha [Streptomyces sp. Inha503]|uniref:thiamine pyrophosphate-dependent dehydrogenase E1 component subunit alpha n=1 Tax=Streptomyces sp. Inha503 TaxID=3383314 RepID=UPI0039A2C15C
MTFETPSTDPWSVLDAKGVLRPEGRIPAGDDALELRAAYRDMVLARRVDTEAIALQRQGELGLWPSMLGQEGAQVGSGSALRPQDVVFPTYREHGVAWCFGIDPVQLLGLFRGTTMGGWDPRERNFYLYSLVIGAQTLHAVGYAMGIVRDGDVGTGDQDRDRAVLVFLGDGALSEGETNEAFVWAAAQNLPVVFFCQNNQWAISAPFSVQSRIPAADRARGFGFPGVRVDGNDVIACHAATHAALTNARAGGGPTLIEAVTYRRNPHTTSDDDLRYRTASENQEWEARDPIERLRLLLTRGDAGEWIDEAFVTDLAREEQELAERLRSGCRALPLPAPGDPFAHTLERTPSELARQRDEHLAFVAAGAGEHA